uniref:Uncharacterized protein n=1 Tax=Rhipicephalus zambeziensis TaxID=60191 RepID=A0A224YFR2_9ACAR
MAINNTNKDEKKKQTNKQTKTGVFHSGVNIYVADFLSPSHNPAAGRPESSMTVGNPYPSDECRRLAPFVKGVSHSLCSRPQTKNIKLNVQAEQAPCSGKTPQPSLLLVLGLKTPTTDLCRVEQKMVWFDELRRM